MTQHQRNLEVIDSHTAGEPTRMVIGGVGPIAGDTMAKKRDWLRTHADDIRSALVLEPRGHQAIVLAFMTEAVSEGSHAGVVFANDAGYLEMCGHGTIGVATSLVRLGKVPVEEPVTNVILDTPPGRVEAAVHVEDGCPRSVVLRNVASYVHQLDVAISVPGHGKVLLDIAWGGNWFAFVHQDELGVRVEPSRLAELLDVARVVRAALADQGIVGVHPDTGETGAIDHVKIFSEEASEQAVAARALTLCPGASWDRSPCGTGTSAKLAILHARGKLSPGEEFCSRSIIGTEFRGTILAETEVGGRLAVIPQIEGSAWVTGKSQFVIEADDPLRGGLSFV